MHRNVEPRTACGSCSPAGRKGSFKINFAELSDFFFTVLLYHLETTDILKYSERVSDTKRLVKTCVTLVLGILRFKCHHEKTNKKCMYHDTEQLETYTSLFEELGSR